MNYRIVAAVFLVTALVKASDPITIPPDTTEPATATLIVKPTEEPKTVTPEPTVTATFFPPNYLPPIPLKKCENVKKIGCFRDNIYDRVLVDQLVANTRDEYNQKFRYPMLDWVKWNTSMQILACRCANSARNLGHKFFGLQFYGECWSGQQLNYKRLGKAPDDGCVGNESPIITCKKEDRFCVGKQFNNYVYRLPNMCNKRYDLGFMLDSSGSITKKNYKKVLRFIANIINEFKVSAPKTHVSLMHFETKPTMDISFKDDIANKQHKLQRKIRGMKKVDSGRTFTKTALVEAGKSMFCETCGTRKNVKKILVVFTDGKSNDKGKIKKKSFAEVKKSLNDQNVRVLAVGIDNKVDYKELKEIASSKKTINKEGKEIIKYDAMKFKTKKLFRKLKNIVSKMCK